MSEKTKPTEQEVQEWLDKVHLSSCCSDPLPETAKTTPKVAPDAAQENEKNKP